MKRQFAIFLLASLAITAFGLIYGPRVTAGLTGLESSTIDTAGTQIVLRPAYTNKVTPTIQTLYLLEAQDVVNRRLQLMQPGDSFEVRVHQGQLEVALPGHEHTPQLINIISQVGQVEFINGGGASPPIGQQIKTGSDTVLDQNVYQTLFTGREIVEIIPPESNSGYVFYQIIPAPDAAKRLAVFLERQAGEYICLVIDKEVINCSKMYYWSGNTLDILPNLSDHADLSLADLAIFLKSGPLPVSLKVVTN